MTPANNNAPERPVQILLIEDNAGDIRLAKEIFAECQLRNDLHVVNDGEEAIVFLKGEPPHARRISPQLILLDLNLPKKRGLDVLAEIKKDASLRHIPIIILTTSNAENDVYDAYALHANCYIQKPIDLEHFINVVKSIEHFWLSTVRLPM